MDSLDASSNSVPEEDEDEDSWDDNEWGLEKGMSLFEVSAKDDFGKCSSLVTSTRCSNLRLYLALR